MSLDGARAEAARVAAHVDLRDVRVWSVAADLVDVPSDDQRNITYNFNADLQVQHSVGSDVLLVLGQYTLELRRTPADATSDEFDTGAGSPEASELTDPSVIATVAFHLNALFVVEEESEEEPFTEAEMTAFGKTTGQFALYPYARELVADMTGRMGLPPLHMGVMRLALESRNG